MSLRLATDPASLKELRARLGITAQQMADELNTPVDTYSPWEQGRRHPPGCLSIALEWVLHQAAGGCPTDLDTGGGIDGGGAPGAG